MTRIDVSNQDKWKAQLPFILDRQYSVFSELTEDRMLSIVALHSRWKIKKLRF